MIGQEQIDDIVQRIVVAVDPDKVILFGSYADGTSHENSDLDILVIKQTDVSPYKRALPIRPLLRDTGVSIDLLVWTEYEYQARRKNPYSVGAEIGTKGKLLYERKQ